MSKVPPAEIKRRVAEALELVRLPQMAERKPRSSPAASSSAWPWRGRWSIGRRCCCSTSRWARST
jgi:hypothetical protein